MAVKFKNIRSGEIRVAETEPMISALWAASDRGPNSKEGQDYGWRIAPEVVVQIKRIRNNPRLLREIADTRSMMVSDIGEKEILKYISDTTSFHAAPVAADEDYEDIYRDEIRRLEMEAAKADEPEVVDSTPEVVEVVKPEAKPKQATKSTK